MFKRLVNHPVAVTKGESNRVVVECAEQIDTESLEFSLLVDATGQHGKNFDPTMRRSSSLLPDAFVVLSFKNQCCVIAKRKREGMPEEWGNLAKLGAGRFQFYRIHSKTLGADRYI